MNSPTLSDPQNSSDHSAYSCNDGTIEDQRLIRFHCKDQDSSICHSSSHTCATTYDPVPSHHHAPSSHTSDDSCPWRRSLATMFLIQCRNRSLHQTADNHDGQ